MPNPWGAPEITVQELDRKRQEGDPFILLDVRELPELERAKVDDGEIVIPLSELASRQLDALPEALKEQDGQVIVMCHHGVRSAQVTAWLRQQGWTNVFSLAGGIDAYAKEIDPDVGVY